MNIIRKRIEVKPDLFTYHLRDGRFVCDHNIVTIVEPCCTEKASHGYIECGCGGRDQIICDNEDCDDLTDENDIEVNNECWG